MYMLIAQPFAQYFAESLHFMLMMSKLFEIKIASAKLSNMKKALEINSNIMPELKTDFPPLGCFTTDIGSLNQYIQIYEYGM